MSGPGEALRRIVVAGAGQLGAIAAIALKRALPGTDVVVIGTPGDPAAFADRAATALPFTNRLHDRLGIEEAEIVARAGGSHRLVTRYLGWGGEGHTGNAPYGEIIDPALRTRFAQDWGGGARGATTGPPPPGSLAEVLADAGRFASTPGGREHPLAEIDYALRWNPPAYRDLLIEKAQRLGVGYVGESITGVEPDDAGGLAAIRVGSGHPIVADLFVDCTGPSAQLANRKGDREWIDWSAALPVWQVFVSAGGPPVAALDDRLRWTGSGWMSEVPGRDGLRTSFAASAPIDLPDVEAVLAYPVAEEIALVPGRAGEAWRGNVVALGDAATRFEPLGGLPLDLAHRQLALLIEMLPGLPISPMERGEFNRRTSLMADAVRDTIALHYAAPAPSGRLEHLERPDGLVRMIDQYQRRGRVPFRDEAPLLPQECSALMAALGFAAGVTPIAAAGDSSATGASARAFLERARAALEWAPPYHEWLAAALSQGRAEDLSYTGE